MSGLTFFVEITGTPTAQASKNVFENPSNLDVFNKQYALLKNLGIESLLKSDCQKRNIIKYNNDYDTFQFTSAINIFLEQAKDMAIINTIYDEEK